MYHEVPDQPPGQSLRQIMRETTRPAATSPVARLRPRQPRTFYRAAAIAAAAVLAGAVLAGSLWTGEPAPAATQPARNGPSLHDDPSTASLPGNASLAPSYRPATPEAIRTEAQEIEGLSGAALFAAFDSLFKQAQAGDRVLAYALGQRLHDCNSRQRLKQQEAASTVTIEGMPDWAQTLDESWRQRCIGLSVVQLDKAEALKALAAKQGHPRALFEQAALTLAAWELAEEEAANAGHPASRTPAQTANALAAVRALEALAQAGDLEAIRALGGVYARGSVVAADEVKFFVYRLIAQHDWTSPATSMDQSPLVAGLDLELQKKVLQEAGAVFNSCCANKEKPR